MNQHPLWYLMSVLLSTLTLLQVHPSSPVLLTKHGPLKNYKFHQRLQWREDIDPAHLKFENRSKATPPPPNSSNHSLCLINLRNSRYPAGNFGGHQLLDGSVSRSPLILKYDERSARQYRYMPPSECPLTLRSSSLVHHLSGPSTHATTQTSHNWLVSCWRRYTN